MSFVAEGQSKQVNARVVVISTPKNELDGTALVLNSVRAVGHFVG